MDSDSVRLCTEEDDVKGRSLTPHTPTNEISLSSSATTVWETPGSYRDAETKSVGRESRTPETPTYGLSSLSTSTPSVWATPNALEKSENLYSFREIISMPALKIDKSNGGLSGEVTARNRQVMNERVTGKSEASANNSVLLNATTDINQSISPLSFHVTVPPNTPQILIEEVATPEDADITVIEKASYPREVKAPSRSSSGVRIVGAIEKIPQTPGEESEKKNAKKGSSKVYIVPEEKPVVEEPVKSVAIISACASPFSPNLSANLNENPVDEVDEIDEVDGPTEPAEETILNGQSHTVVNGFTDAEMLVTERHDCDDVLGGCLVRLCPSMRPYRRLFAKGFMVVLLVVIVAFILFMVMLTRS